ncbi:MAG: M48 family metallopeptidase [Alphaproteobacteria bacterium]|nr:M48 family metallopeptidase [Alphaproteobacteria bacterium]
MSEPPRPASEGPTQGPWSGNPAQPPAPGPGPDQAGPAAAAFGAPLPGQPLPGPWQHPGPDAAPGTPPASSEGVAQGHAVPPVGPWAPFPLPGPLPGPWGQNRDQAQQPQPAAEAAPPRPRPAPEVMIASTDFAAAIAKNRRRTYWLLGFLTLIAAILGWLIGSVIDTYSDPYARVALFSPAGAFGMISMAGASGIWSGIALKSGDRIALHFAGAEEVTPEQQPQLFNVVEEMAIAAGVPMPRVYVIHDETPNAFATGMRPERSAVAVTTGLMHMLTRDELQGVMAHEVGHIINNDIRYATVVAVTAGLIALVCDVALRALRHAPRSSGRSKGGGNAILLVILIVFAILAPIAARMVQMAISREREYLADATAVKLTRHPQGLIGALQKLEAAPVSATELAGGRALQHLWIVNPLKRFGEKASALFSTHPATELRIERLRKLG